MFDYPDAGTAAPGRRAFLGDLHEDEVATIVHYGQARRFAGGEPAVTERGRERTVWIVTAGRFTVRRGGRTVGSRVTGDVFGDLCFFDGLAHAEDVTADGPAEALAMTVASFDRLRLAEPRLAVLFLMDLGRLVTATLRSERQASATRRGD